MKKGLAIAFVVLVCFSLGSFLFSAPILAQDETERDPGGGEVDLGAPIGGTGRTNLAGYIVLIYNFAVVAGISLAILVIIFAGYRYMMSSGDPQSLEEAKELLLGAIVGLVLIFLTRLILGSIDSRLVQIDPHPPEITQPFTSDSNDETGSVEEEDEPTNPDS